MSTVYTTTKCRWAIETSLSPCSSCADKDVVIVGDWWELVLWTWSHELEQTENGKQDGKRHIKTCPWNRSMETTSFTHFLIYACYQVFSDEIDAFQLRTFCDGSIQLFGPLFSVTGILYVSIQRHALECKLFQRGSHFIKTRLDKVIVVEITADLSALIQPVHTRHTRNTSVVNCVRDTMNILEKTTKTQWSTRTQFTRTQLCLLDAFSKIRFRWIIENVETVFHVFFPVVPAYPKLLHLFISKLRPLRHCRW